MPGSEVIEAVVGKAMMAAGVVPQGGGAVAMVVAAIFVGMICVIVAIETGRSSVAWGLAGLVGTVVLVSVIRTVVTG
ncbi:hypothetical protein R3Q06_30535 [Rhodococcus erythropolis]|uniref:hypothetical protein n=1 Tax=Rhodococcus erythropolis TaxID=1833 RepID=UPI002948DCB2|nr:hypothetical protein [Rhodococcus erythropolis]MDV6277835.1 hypothetical protein [Rhodococcus erythropolis]